MANNEACINADDTHSCVEAGVDVIEVEIEELIAHVRGEFWLSLEVEANHGTCFLFCSWDDL